MDIVAGNQTKISNIESQVDDQSRKLKKGNLRFWRIYALRHVSGSDARRARVVIFSFFSVMFMFLSFSIGNSDSQFGCFFIITGWYDLVADTRIHH